MQPRSATARGRGCSCQVPVYWISISCLPGRRVVLSDFYQNRAITVHHQLGNPILHSLEQGLFHYGRIHPIELVQPSLYVELGHPVLNRIVDKLAELSTFTRSVWNQFISTSRT